LSPEATARILPKFADREVKMKQKRLSFVADEHPQWEDLPVRTRSKIQQLVGQLIEQAWHRHKEGKNEPKDNG
jgi:hypothetical protein